MRRAAMSQSDKSSGDGGVNRRGMLECVSRSALDAFERRPARARHHLSGAGGRAEQTSLSRRSGERNCAVLLFFAEKNFRGINLPELQSYYARLYEQTL